VETTAVSRDIDMGQDSSKQRDHAHRWEAILNRLVLFEQKEQNADLVHFVHYTGITCRAELFIRPKPERSAERARKLIARSDSGDDYISLALVAADGAPLFVIRELVVDYSVRDTAAAAAAAAPVDVFLCTQTSSRPRRTQWWRTDLSIWMQKVQQRKGLSSGTSFKLHLAFDDTFSYSTEERALAQRCSFFSGPITLHRDCCGVGVGGGVERHATFARAVRNMDTGLTEFYSTDADFAAGTSVSAYTGLGCAVLGGGGGGGGVVWTGVVIQAPAATRRSVLASPAWRTHLVKQLRQRSPLCLVCWLDAAENETLHGSMQRTDLARIRSAYMHIEALHIFCMADAEIDADVRYMLNRPTSAGHLGALSQLMLFSQPVFGVISKSAESLTADTPPVNESI
jgi:hypothetical protein